MVLFASPKQFGAKHKMKDEESNWSDEGRSIVEIQAKAGTC